MRDGFINCYRTIEASTSHITRRSPLAGRGLGGIDNQRTPCPSVAMMPSGKRERMHHFHLDYPTVRVCRADPRPTGAGRPAFSAGTLTLKPGSADSRGRVYRTCGATQIDRVSVRSKKTGINT